MNLLESLVFWHWLVAALVLLVLEVFAPGTVFLWLGVSAAVVGVVLAILPSIPWQIQFVLFAVFAVVAIVAWRSYQRKHPAESDQPTLNRRGEQYIGRVLTLDDPIVNGVGKVHVDDSTWKINGADADAGTRVRVTDVRGTVLQVERAD